jgi:type IV pilus assembly protein PilW
MVGLTIGLVLSLGLFKMISGQSTAFKVQDDFARMQENGTFALRYIGDSLRMAGFYGYVTDPTSIDITTDGIVTNNDCGSGTSFPPNVTATTNWALQVAAPIQAFTNLTPATVNATLPCILASNFYQGPILVTRGAIGYRMPQTVIPTHPVANGDLSFGLAAQTDYATNIYVQSDPNAGLLFYGGDFVNLKANNNTRTTSTGADVDIFQYATYVYYLRPCSRPSGGGSTCTGAADDSGQPIPTLARQELQGSTMTETPLVEGIERIYYSFGIDNVPAGGDGIPDTFTATPAAADWQNIVAVRVSVLVRSTSLSANYNDTGKTYDLAGDGTVVYNCNLDLTTPNACRYKRKVFSQTFQLRNIAQRRGA